MAELGLIKVLREGIQAYALPPRLIEAETSGEDRLRKLLADLPVEVHEAGLLLVVRTLPGSAHAIAARSIGPAGRRWRAPSPATTPCSSRSRTAGRCSASSAVCSASPRARRNIRAPRPFLFDERAAAARPARLFRHRLRGTDRETWAIDLYRVKPAITRALEPLLAALERARVSPDAVTLAAIPIGALAGAAILLSRSSRRSSCSSRSQRACASCATSSTAPLRGGPAGCIRVASCTTSWAIAARTCAMLAPVALVAGAIEFFVWIGVVLALLASFTAVATRAAGGSRTYRGVLSKPGRMALLSIFAVAVLIAGEDAWWPFGPLLVAGTALTLAGLVGGAELA